MTNTDSLSSQNHNQEALLNHKNNAQIQNGMGRAAGPSGPPDGGPRAWFIMVGSFFCNGILFGVINSYSVFYTKFESNLSRENISDATSEAALVGSLQMGTIFFISPISGVLTNFIGLRQTTFLGGAIASSGMFLSSFCVDNVVALCITFGVMYGLGGALAYTPSLAILGHYFKRYLGIVNGIVTAGSAVFTTVMPFVIGGLLDNFGTVWTLRILAFFACMIMACAFLFKPNGTHKELALKDAFNTAVFKNKKYVIWTLTIAFSLFGYFVPYVYMVKFVKTNFPAGVNDKVPILCIGITSGLGRLLFGYIADLPRVNRIYLQQIAFFSIGVLTMLLPSTKGNFPLLVLATLGMGLFDGCFISLLGPIAFDICGHDGATQAIGFLLGACSIPLTIGPYVAGKIYESQQSYTLPFLLAGIPPTIGSLLMFSVRLVKENPKKTQENHEAQGRLTSTEAVDGGREDDGPV